MSLYSIITTNTNASQVFDCEDFDFPSSPGNMNLKGDSLVDFSNLSFVNKGLFVSPFHQYTSKHVETFHYKVKSDDKNGNSSSQFPVPEPATILLFGSGLIGLAGNRIRKKYSGCPENGVHLPPNQQSKGVPLSGEAIQADQ